ncbi:MAG: hydrogenase nickel incorporation protein HypB [Chloroflexota bacterium]
MEIKVLRNIMEVNDYVARENRRVFDEKRILVLNLVSSPGAGKTTLLERTLDALKSEYSMAVIEGDIATQLDAERIQRHGVPVLQINTQGGCHLDANMIRNAIESLDLDGVRILFIENVGNLVCPAEFALGEDMKVTILSVTEGDDKPEKYPVMFQQSKALVINKIDLLPYVDFDVEAAKRRALALNPRLTVFEVSCRTGQGLADWLGWLRAKSEERACGQA